MTPNAQPTRVESFDRSALAQLLEPPYTDPYVRWCGRGGAARLPPIPIFGVKRAFVASNQERVTNGTMMKSSARRSIKRKRPAGITPPALSCNCRLAGPVPLLCIPSCWIDLIGSAERRLTPLHAGMVRPYRGRLPLRNWNGAGYPLV